MSTREAIVEAATELFAEKGYEGMTIKEIANKVGITPPAVYAFFKNKKDVFLQIYKEVLGGHLDLAKYYAHEFQHQSVKQQLEQFLRDVMAYQLKDEQQMKIFMRLLLFPPEVFDKDLKADLLQMEAMEYELFCQIFERGIQSGEVKPGDSRSYATGMICMMDGLFWEMQRYDVKTFWEKFEITWSQFWQGIAK